MARFPWPVTDEDLVLDNALASVLNAYDARGDEEEAVVREAAAKLIIELIIRVSAMRRSCRGLH